ncbi:hypothetical protein Trco_004565 [Trichoderma cornu-damae]|uniref:Uncharacterized protein n=1 Tax=Trichoderma cornu-damae TaxID=654480 RepID=A0A9P8QTD0_9HYPO|nr:hypothetical protein Trco_004565 [Trichoderma cornu-damae]
MGPTHSQPSRPSSASPPCSPRAWTWKCHHCKRRYPLSCTRRCLYCSHTLCFSREGSRANKETSSCHTEFDYPGWQTYYEWRHELQERNPSAREANASTAAESSDEETTEQPEEPAWLERMLEDTYDCTVDCAYPSECFHKLKDLAEEPVYKPSSTPSSTRPKRTKETKRAKKAKSRRHRHFQRQPSRLNQEWRVQRFS